MALVLSGLSVTGTTYCSALIRVNPTDRSGNDPQTNLWDDGSGAPADTSAGSILDGSLTVSSLTGVSSLRRIGRWDHPDNNRFILNAVASDTGLGNAYTGTTNQVTIFYEDADSNVQTLNVSTRRSGGGNWVDWWEGTGMTTAEWNMINGLAANDEIIFVMHTGTATYTAPTPATPQEIRVGDTTPSAYYVGDTAVTKIYLGDTEIYSSGITVTFVNAVATGTGRAARLTFNPALDETHLPPTSAFRLSTNGGNLIAPTQRSFVNFDSQRVLNLRSGAFTGTLSSMRATYTKPTDTNDRLQDADGNEVDDFDLTYYALPNAMIDSITHDGSGNTNIVLSFTEPLDTSHVPTTAAFNVIWSGNSQTTNSVSFLANGNLQVVVAGESPTALEIEYDKPGTVSQRLQNADGDEVADFDLIGTTT